jgi:hypothetical protein
MVAVRRAPTLQLVLLNEILSLLLVLPVALFHSIVMFLCNSSAQASGSLRTVPGVSLARRQRPGGNAHQLLEHALS